MQAQQDNLCDYPEKSVYTIEMFTRRNATLTKEIKQLQASETNLMRKQESGSQASKAAMETIPATNTAWIITTSWLSQRKTDRGNLFSKREPHAKQLAEN